MSTLSFSRVTLGALALASSLAGSACEVGRPEGFIPKPREARTGNPDLFADSGTEPMGGNNGDIDDPDFPVDDVDGGMPVSPDSPLAKAAGYYWLRTDIEFTYSQQAGFETLRVFNRASHFALTRLRPSGQVLTAVERTCHIFYQHECKAACSTFTTTVSPAAVKLYRQDLPRVYTLTNNNTMFVTDENSLLLGWTGAADKMPTSLSDPTVWDASPEQADSKGFYVNVRASGLPQVVDCYYNTVERFTSSYSGSLKAGGLDGVNAKLSTEGSDAETLDYQGGGSCVPSNTSPPAPSLSTVRFVKVDESETFGDCPTIADFKAKLPDP